MNVHVPGSPQAFPRAPVTLGNLPTSIEIHMENLTLPDVSHVSIKTQGWRVGGCHVHASLLYLLVKMTSC